MGQQIELQRQAHGRKSGSVIEQETDGVIYQKLLQRIENGEKPLESLTPKQLQALATALGWTVREMEEATKIDLGTKNPNGWIDADNIRTDSVSITHRVRVPVYALAAAGAGVWTDTAVIEEIDVEPEIANLPHRVTLKVDGDSMSPTLESGDAIHIDPTQTTIQDGRVYVVKIISDGVVVKRARIYHGGIVQLVSDNPRYAPMHPDDATVIGRVVAVTPQTRKL